MRTGELREVCRIPFLPHAPGEVPTGAGWYYARTYCIVSHERVTFTEAGDPAVGSDVFLRCPQAERGTSNQHPVCTAGSESCTPGELCEPGEGDGCRSGGYVCDPVARRCALPCTSNADCARAGYPTFTCDTRTLADIYFFNAEPNEYELNTARNVCENPECALDR